MCHVAVGDAGADDRGAARSVPMSDRCSSTAEPKPPASTFSSIVTSSSWRGGQRRSAARRRAASRSARRRRSARCRSTQLLGGAERQLHARSRSRSARPARPRRASRPCRPGSAPARAGIGDADARAARIAHRDRPVVLERRAQHVHEHRLVARRHQHHVRERAQVTRCRTRRGGSGRRRRRARRGPCRTSTLQVLEADVVDDLVVPALEEGGVDRRTPGACPRAPGRRRTARRAARRSRRRSTGRAPRAASIDRPVPPAIAAVMPITRGSRRASATSARAEHLRVLGRRLGADARPLRGRSSPRPRAAAR